jgi:hypothetical protein
VGRLATPLSLYQNTSWLCHEGLGDMQARQQIFPLTLSWANSVNLLPVYAEEPNQYQTVYYYVQQLK